MHATQNVMNVVQQEQSVTTLMQAQRIASATTAEQQSTTSMQAQKTVFVTTVAQNSTTLMLTRTAHAITAKHQSASVNLSTRLQAQTFQQSPQSLNSVHQKNTIHTQKKSILSSVMLMKFTTHHMATCTLLTKMATSSPFTAHTTMMVQRNTAK